MRAATDRCVYAPRWSAWLGRRRFTRVLAAHRPSLRRSEGTRTRPASATRTDRDDTRPRRRSAAGTPGCCAGSRAWHPANLRTGPHGANRICRIRCVSWRQAPRGSEQRRLARRLETQVFVRATGGRAPAWGALQQAALQEIGLVDVLERVGLVVDGDGQGREADGTAGELRAYGGEDLAVEAVESQLVDLQHRQRRVGRRVVDRAGAAHLGPVAHP